MTSGDGLSVCKIILAFVFPFQRDREICMNTNCHKNNKFTGKFYYLKKTNITPNPRQGSQSKAAATSILALRLFTILSAGEISHKCPVLRVSIFRTPKRLGT